MWIRQIVTEQSSYVEIAWHSKYLVLQVFPYVGKYWEARTYPVFADTLLSTKGSSKKVPRYRNATENVTLLPSRHNPCINIQHKI